MDIQQRCYRLLTWLSSAVEKGFIRLGAAHRYASRSGAAAAWIREHYHNLPPDARPPQPSGRVLGQFCNFFASYFQTSFEIDPEPGTRWVSACGCYCDLCAYAARAPYIRPKRLFPPHKRDAERLKRRFLEELAARNELASRPETITEILRDPELGRNAALASYGEQILRRCRGAHTNPGVLALWRQFAWKPTGSPIRGFELSHHAILDAQQRLLEALEERLAPA
ncbi:MAG: hypothetical protein QNK04_16630 [Myxococcota bacterium]|nr:hypothetical protein [Myxococcota bacterium]